MSAEEFEAWLLQHPGLLMYLGGLLIGSLVAFVIVIRQVSRSRQLDENPIPPWPIKSLDFGLFLVCLVLWFLLSGTLLVHAQSLIFGEDSTPGTGIMVLGGFLLQAGMLYLFLRFKFHYRTPTEGPLSPKIIPLHKSILLGFTYFLASLPVIYGVGVIWNGILEFLRRKGIEIELPLQDAVLLLQETRNPLIFFGLVFLAVVVAPVVEEAVFRAGIFRFLKGRMSLFFALLISGTLFGMVHGNLQSLPGLITVGICLGLAYELSGSLRVPIFFHAFFNLNSILWILLLPDTMTV